MKLWGMEAPDLLICLMVFAVMSLLFSGTFLEIPLTFGFPFTCLFILAFAKRDKPEKFLTHFSKYYLTEGFHSCQERKDF
jgi:hypothetical protein